MADIKWSTQNPSLDDYIHYIVESFERITYILQFDRIQVSEFFKDGDFASVSYMPMRPATLVDMVNHIKELPKLEDGVQLNDNLWVRIVFVDWELGTVSKYTLFANGLSPHRELLNEAIGSEQCEGKQLNELPECIATPLLMRRVRGKDTVTIHMPNSRTIWMNDLQVTVEDVKEITRRDKWEYQPQGKSICKELINLLHQQGRTRGSA